MPQRAKRGADSAGLSEQSASRRRKASTKRGHTAAFTKLAQASAPHTPDTLGCEAVGQWSDRQHQQQGSQVQRQGQGLQHVESIKGPQGYLELLKAVSYQSQQVQPLQKDQTSPDQRGPATVLANGQQRHSEGGDLALAQQGSQQQQQPRRRGWPKGKPRKQVSTVSGTSAAVGVAANAADLAGVVKSKHIAARLAAAAGCKDTTAAAATAAPKSPHTQLQESPRHNSSDQRAHVSGHAADQPAPQQQQQQRDERIEPSDTSHTSIEHHKHEIAASTDSPPPSGPPAAPVSAAAAADTRFAVGVPSDHDLPALISRKLSHTASSQLQGVLQQHQQQHQQSPDSPIDDHSPMSDQSLLPADEALMVWPQQMQQQQQISMSPAAAAAAASSRQSPSKHTAPKVPVKPGGLKGSDYQPTYKVGHRHVVMCKQSSSVAAAYAAAGPYQTVTPRLQTEFFDRFPLPQMQCNHSDAVLTPATAAAAPAAADLMQDPDLTHLKSRTKAQDFKLQQQQRRRQQKEKEQEAQRVNLQGCGVPARDRSLQKQPQQQQQLLQLQRAPQPHVPDILAQLAEHLRQLSGGANQHAARTGGTLAWQQQQQMVDGSSDLAHDHLHSSDRPMMQAAAVPGTIATATDSTPAAAAAAGQSGKVSLQRQASAGDDLVAEALLQLQQQAAAPPLEGVSDGSCGTAEAQLQLPFQRSWPGRQQQQQQHRRPGGCELHLPSLGAVFGGAAAAANHGSAAGTDGHGVMPIAGIRQQQQQQQQKTRESSSRRKGPLGHVALQSQPQRQQQQSTGTPTLLQQLLAKRQQAKKLALPGTAAAAAAGGGFGLSGPKMSQELAALLHAGSLSAANNSSNSLQAPQAAAAAISPSKGLEAAPLADPACHAADLATDPGSSAAVIGADNAAAAAAAAAAAESPVKAHRIAPGPSISKPAASAATAATGILPDQLLDRQHAQQQQQQQQQLFQLQEVISSMLTSVQRHQSQLQNVTVLLQQQQQEQQQQQQCGAGSNGGSGVCSDLMPAVHNLWEQQPQHIVSLLLCHQHLGRILMSQPHKQQQQEEEAHKQLHNDQQQQQHKRLHNDQQRQQRKRLHNDQPSKRPSLDRSQKTQPCLRQHHQHQQPVSSSLEVTLPCAAIAVPLALDPPPPSMPNMPSTRHSTAEPLPATAAGSRALLPHVSWSAADMAEAVVAFENGAVLEQHSQERLQVKLHPATVTVTDDGKLMAATVTAAAGDPQANHTGTQESGHTAATDGGSGGGGVACIGEVTNHITAAAAADGAAAAGSPAAAGHRLLLLAKQLLQQLQQFPAGLTTLGIRKLLLQRAAAGAAAAVDGSSATAAWALEDRQVDCLVQQLLAARLIKQQQQQSNPSAQASGGSSIENSVLVVTEAGRKMLKLHSWWDCAQTFVTYLADHGKSDLCKDYLGGLVSSKVDSQVIQGALRLCQILGLIPKTEPHQLDDGDTLALALCQQH